MLWAEWNLPASWAEHLKWIVCIASQFAVFPFDFVYDTCGFVKGFLNFYKGIVIIHFYTGMAKFHSEFES